MVVNYNSMRIRKLKMSQLKGLSGHNQRLYQEQGKRIDYSQSMLNENLFGGDKDIRESVLDRIKNKGARISKGEHNASVVAVEMVISASPTYFRYDPLKWGEFDKEKVDVWKAEIMNYLHNKFGENLVNAVLHLDEATPHIHATITPIVEKARKKRRTAAQIKSGVEGEKYITNVLDAKTMFNKFALRELQTEMAQPLEKLGIYRGIKNSKAPHTRTKEYWRRMRKNVLEKVDENLPKIRLDNKSILESSKAYIQREEERLNEAMSLIYNEFIEKLESSDNYRKLYELERKKTGYIRQVIKPYEEVDDFVKKFNRRNELKKVEINKLDNKLVEAHEKIVQIEKSNTLLVKKLEKAREEAFAWIDKLPYSDIEKSRLKRDLGRARDNDRGFSR